MCKLADARAQACQQTRPLRQCPGARVAADSIRINAAGLYAVRRAIATDGQGVVESKSLQVQGTVDKGVGDGQQDKLFEEIKLWELLAERH